MRCVPISIQILALVFATSCFGGQQEKVDTSLQPLPPPRIDPVKMEAMCPGTPIESTVSLSQESGEAEVYAVSYPKVDEQYAANLANKLGIEGEVTYNDLRKSYEVYGPEATLRVRQGGYFEIASEQEISSTSLISDEEAAEIGLGYIRKWGLLLNEDLQWNISSRNSSETHVLFEPRSGIPFQRVLVFVTGSGKVRFLEYRWPDLIILNSYPLISQQEAFERLKKCQTYDGLRLPWDQQISEVRLAYISSPDEYQPEYLVPVYEFVFAYEGDDTGGLQVPALPDEYILPATAGE